MRVHADIVKGLAHIYGEEDQTVWVYQNASGDTKFWARPNDLEAPRRHRDYRQHRLVGALDLVSGRVTGAQDEPSREPLAIGADWVEVLLWLVKGVVGLAAAAAVFIIALCTGVGISKGR